MRCEEGLGWCISYSAQPLELVLLSLGSELDALSYMGVSYCVARFEPILLTNSLISEKN